MTDLQIRYIKWPTGMWYHCEVKFGAGSWHWSTDKDGNSKQEIAYKDGEIGCWWWLIDAIQFKQEQEKRYG